MTPSRSSGRALQLLAASVLTLMALVAAAPAQTGSASLAGTVHVEGEFVEMLGREGRRPLFDGLEAMDRERWAQGSTRPAYIGLTSHSVDLSNSAVIPLGRFLPSHCYWSGTLKQVDQSK